MSEVLIATGVVPRDPCYLMLCEVTDLYRTCIICERWRAQQPVNRQTCVSTVEETVNSQHAKHTTCATPQKSRKDVRTSAKRETRQEDLKLHLCDRNGETSTLTTQWTHNLSNPHWKQMHWTVWKARLFMHGDERHGPGNVLRPAAHDQLKGPGVHMINGLAYNGLPDLKGAVSQKLKH